MNHGKNTCNHLKAIRQQIADANEIEYCPHECNFEGECSGTCPACEGEMRYIESELRRRQRLGKKIALVGLAVAGFVGTETSCGFKDEGDVIDPRLQGDVVDTTNIQPIDTSCVSSADTTELMGIMVPEIDGIDIPNTDDGD
ncbi:MAG: hypothetical protein J6T60_10935 [Bacteroidales bacterium]|nr:hypothetical protein [Bacteroidales bacterium]